MICTWQRHRKITCLTHQALKKTPRIIQVSHYLILPHPQHPLPPGTPHAHTARFSENSCATRPKPEPLRSHQPPSTTLPPLSRSLKQGVMSWPSHTAITKVRIRCRLQLTHPSCQHLAIDLARLQSGGFSKHLVDVSIRSSHSCYNQVCNLLFPPAMSID